MNQVTNIQEQLLAGSINVNEAVDEIDQLIGGITSVNFRADRTFKISNHREIYSLMYKGSRKQEPLVYALACAAYLKAQRNGSLRPGEVHISESASTKHHKDGIYRILERYCS